MTKQFFPSKEQYYQNLFFFENEQIISYEILLCNTILYDKLFKPILQSHHWSDCLDHSMKFFLANEQNIHINGGSISNGL